MHVRFNAAARALLPLALAMSSACVSATGANVAFTPQVGVYRPGDDAFEVADVTLDGELEKENSLALGLAAEAGPIRGSLLYATAATIAFNGGPQFDGDVGEGTLLAGAVDFVIRPFGALPIQPYLLGGVGLKNFDYSFDEDEFEDLVESETEFALHYGAGVDLLLGRMGLMVELSDFLSFEDKEFGRNDTFLMAGLKFRL